MNGDYSVSITAEGYIGTELPVNIDCNPAHCESCSPSAPVALNQKFCRNKQLKLIVKDASTNLPVEGADVSSTLEFYNGPRQFATFVTGISGEVFIPIPSNGVYQASVSMEGYISYSTSYEVFIPIPSNGVYQASVSMEGYIS